MSIGPRDDLHEHTVNYLQTIFCPHRQQNSAQACRCNACTGIADQQSAHVTWLSPTKEYVLKDLDQLFTTIRFSLEQGTHHAFVIQEAHLLTTACANRLLKVLEEPPAGYFFILLTANYHAVLPTIQSRSTIVYEAAHDTPPHEGLLTFYTSPKKLRDPQGFDQALRNAAITLPETRLLVHQLVSTINYTAFRQPEKVQSLLVTAQRRLPQPGGATHYLRWLYMQLHFLEYQPS